GQYGPDAHPNDEWCEWSSSRRMKTYLNLEKFKYTTYSGAWEAGYRINTWQKAQKKSWGIWVNYYVRYRIGDILYKENGVTKFSESGFYTTGSIKPSYTHIIYSVITIYSPYEPSLNSVIRPYPIYFKCFSTNEDFGDYYQIQISYSD
ncbi:MAG: hypothetical protein P1P88_22405, partial [Bacteroidales bacterium]|nr:hypothetical protein [Bacteroidales bacterium]